MWLCPALLNLVCGKSWHGKCDLALMPWSLCISIDKQIHLIGSYGNWSSQSSKGWAESHPLFDGSTNTLSMPLQQRYHLAGELQTATGHYFVDSLFFFSFYAASPLFLCCHMPKNGVKIKHTNVPGVPVTVKENDWGVCWQQVARFDCGYKPSNSVGFLILKDKRVREPSAMSFPTPAADCEDVRDYSNYKLLFGEKKFSKSHSASSVTSWEFEDKTRL